MQEAQAAAKAALQEAEAAAESAKAALAKARKVSKLTSLGHCPVASCSINAGTTVHMNCKPPKNLATQPLLHWRTGDAPIHALILWQVATCWLFFVYAANCQQLSFHKRCWRSQISPSGCAMWSKASEVLAMEADWLGAVQAKLQALYLHTQYLTCSYVFWPMSSLVATSAKCQFRGVDHSKDCRSQLRQELH